MPFSIMLNGIHAFARVCLLNKKTVRTEKESMQSLYRSD